MFRQPPGGHRPDRPASPARCPESAAAVEPCSASHRRLSAPACTLRLPLSCAHFCALELRIELQRVYPRLYESAARLALCRERQRAAAGVEDQSHGAAAHFALDRFACTGTAIESAVRLHAHRRALAVAERKETNVANHHLTRLVQRRRTDGIPETRTTGFPRAFRGHARAQIDEAVALEYLERGLRIHLG